MNSIFDKNEFKKEYEVVVEENIRNENDADVIVDENLDILLYKGSSYEFHIDNIKYHKKHLNYNDVLQYYKNFYIPCRFVLSIVSNTHFDTIKSYIKKSYFMKDCKPNNDFLLKHSIHLNITPQHEIQYNLHKKIGIVTNVLSIGFRICNDLCSDKYAIKLLNTMFNGLSGKLSILLRENNGLTYTSSSSVSFYEHTGDFVISAETDSKKLLKNGNKKGVLPLIIQLLNDLINHGVTSKEIEFAKKTKQEKMNIKKEDNYNLAEHNGKEILMYGNSHKIISYSDIFDTFYKDLNKTHINNVIKKYFKPENMSVCIVGENIPALTTIKNECEKLCKET
jgi:predicted Zn-dependent peptidase